MLLDFYNPVDVSASKEKILDDIASLKLENAAKLVPIRRVGDQTTVKEVDDIFTLITYCDENVFRTTKYVGDNPDQLPTMKMDKTDIILISNKME